MARKHHTDRHAQYLRVVHWARRRYTVGGLLVLSRGDTLTTYSRIEEAAFDRYIRNPRDADGRLIFPA